MTLLMSVTDALFASGGAASGETHPLVAVAGQVGGVCYFVAFAISTCHIAILWIRGHREAAREEWHRMEDEHRIHLKANRADKRR